MRRFLWLFRSALVPALLSGAVHGETSNLTIVVVSSFGEPLNSCRVESFRPYRATSETAGEYSNRFLGLSAKGIPYGGYEAFLRCSEGPLHAVIGLDRSDQFEVIARNERVILGERGDPKLVIALDGSQPARSLWWVRLVGLYNLRNYVSEFSAATREARLDAPDPGSYLVTVLSTDGYHCVKEVDLVEDTRRWVFHASACNFEFDRYAHGLEGTGATNHTQSDWYRQIQRDRDAFFRMLQDKGQKK
jgi:hypothetical protein